MLQKQQGILVLIKRELHCLYWKPCASFDRYKTNYWKDSSWLNHYKSNTRVSTSYGNLWKVRKSCLSVTILCWARQVGQPLVWSIVKCSPCVGSGLINIRPARKNYKWKNWKVCLKGRRKKVMTLTRGRAVPRRSLQQDPRNRRRILLRWKIRLTAREKRKEQLNSRKGIVRYVISFTPLDRLLF